MNHLSHIRIAPSRCDVISLGRKDRRRGQEEVRKHELLSTEGAYTAGPRQCPLVNLINSFPSLPPHRNKATGHFTMFLSHNTFGSGAKCVVSLVMFSGANLMTLSSNRTFRFHFGVCFRKPEGNQTEKQCPTKTPHLTTTRTVGLLKNLTIQQFFQMNSNSFAGTNRRLRELV